MLIATRILDLFSALAIMLACIGAEINFGYLVATSVKLLIGTAVLVNLVIQSKRFMEEIDSKSTSSAPAMDDR